MTIYQCINCEKTFAFTTYISFDYEVTKADCLNGGEHKLRKVSHAPKIYPDWVVCESCGWDDKGEEDKDIKY